MTSDNLLSDSLFALSPHVHVLPIVHGSGDMAHMVREVILSRRIDCLGVPLPPSVETLVEQGIDQLPVISIVAIPEQEDDGKARCSFVPIDPCQPVIMGIRAAMSEDIPRAYVDREVRLYRSDTWVGPDPYALQYMPLEAFSSASVPFLPPPRPQSARWERICWMAFRLHELELDFHSILFLCPLMDWPWVRQAYQERKAYASPEHRHGLISWWKVMPDTLYFVLGELPYVTQLYEERREEARADTHLSIDGIKELVLETRSRWCATRSAATAREANWVTPQLLQLYFQYVRNLTLLEHRLKPDLYTLVLAAKQMAGDEFALKLLETSKTYVYQHRPSVLDARPGVFMGVGQLQDPDGEVLQAVNRLQGYPVSWRSISLKPTQAVPKKQSWAHQWNPYRQCSWPPEDHRIESFAAHVRQESRQILGADLARSEKFQSSLEDGIDLRETLRQWAGAPHRHLRDIHVKVTPRVKGSIEALVFFFEVPADPHTFSWQTTWYAEHPEESTLSFYATPFVTNMIGPGIGESRYGGALFLFPPRFIPDIWENPLLDFATSLEERLLAGACAHSRERHVAVVSPIPLKAAWRTIAHRFRRKLIPIPLHRFSGQMIARLRRFHVLNGHDIRSYAARFIHE